MLGLFKLSALSLSRDTSFLPQRGGTVGLQMNILTYIFFCHASTAVMGLSIFIVGVSRLHSIKHATLVMAPPGELRSRCKNLYLITQHSQEIDNHTSGGIRTRNPNKSHASWCRPHFFVFRNFLFLKVLLLSRNYSSC